MHDLVSFLKKAISRLPNAGVMGCYCIRDNAIYARSAGLMAGVTMESAAEFNVPAAEFESALGRMKEITALSFDGASLAIRAGRLKATIQCVQDEPPAVPAMPSPNAWSPCPVNLLDVLKAVMPFMAESGVYASIRIMGDRVTAMNNRSGVDITLPGVAMLPALLSADAVDFLVGQDTPPDEYTVDNGAAVFRWHDGRWLRAQMVAGDWPDIVEKILDSVGTAAPVEVTREWRDAYADASALSDGTVQMTPKGLRALRGAGSADVEIDITALPDNHNSYWPTAQLDSIVPLATHWNPAAYPEPSLFVGHNVRGVLVGLRR